MLGTFRILAGLAAIGLLLGVASWAVRDCEVALSVYENCVWLDVRDALALPRSKLLRAVLLQAIGLILLGGIHITWRYLFRRKASVDADSAEGARPV